MKMQKSALFISMFIPKSRKLLRSYIYMKSTRAWRLFLITIKVKLSKNGLTKTFSGYKHTFISFISSFPPEFDITFCSRFILHPADFMFIIIYRSLSFYLLFLLFSWVVLPFWFLFDAITCISVACRVISFCRGSSVEGEGEGGRGEYLRQPLHPLPRCHPPSVTSDCPFSSHHPHPDEPPHKDWGLL